MSALSYLDLRRLETKSYEASVCMYLCLMLRLYASDLDLCKFAWISNTVSGMQAPCTPVVLPPHPLPSARHPSLPPKHKTTYAFGECAFLPSTPAIKKFDFCLGGSHTRRSKCTPIGGVVSGNGGVVFGNGGVVSASEIINVEVDEHCAGRVKHRRSSFRSCFKVTELLGIRNRNYSAIPPPKRNR